MTEKTDVRTVGSKIIVPVILGLILLFMGVSITAKAFCLLKRPVDVSDIYWTDIDGKRLVFAKDVNIIDPFMYIDGENGRTTYCIVSFADASGDMCIATMPIEETDGLNGFLEKYLADENAYVGSYAINGYFTASENDVQSSKLYSAFSTVCEEYKDTFSQGSRLYYNGSVRMTNLSLKYLCGENESYIRIQGAGNEAEGIIGICVAVAGFIGIVYSVAVLLNIGKKGDCIRREKR